MPGCSSVLCQLEAGGGGVRVDSTTEDVPSQSVPDPWAGGQEGQREGLVVGGHVDLCLVVGGDQDTWKSRAQLSI